MTVVENLKFFDKSNHVDGCRFEVTSDSPNCKHANTLKKKGSWRAQES